MVSLTKAQGCWEDKVQLDRAVQEGLGEELRTANLNYSSKEFCCYREAENWSFAIGVVGSSMGFISYGRILQKGGMWRA